MSWNYAYTPYIWLSFTTVLLLIALLLYSGLRRNVPGALPFMIGCLFAALWAAGSVMEYAAVDVETKVFWAKFQSVWQLPLVTAILCFVLEYAWHGRWLTRRNLILLSIPSFLVLGLILTNDLHHLTWKGFEFDGSVMPRLGPVGWIAFSYAYAVILANIVVLVWLFIRSPYHRWPVIVMLIGQFGGRTIFLLERFRILHAILPIEVVGMGFEFLMYLIALFGLRIFDPIPMARQTVITQMRDGMLALDAQGRVVSLNPAAELFLGATAKQIMGKPARELLPACPDGHLTGLSESEIEFSRETGDELRYYTLAISPLKDWREVEIGCLLLLHDVTAQKRAQAQLLEQEKVVASLHEREQLARELHDSIGQVLGYAGLKMGAARKLIADGKLAKADDQLAHLESSLAVAHADVREYILNLRTTPNGDKPFFSALRQYLDEFHQNYGMEVEISICPSVSEDIFTRDMQMQLFRIMQEALSNAHKHSATDQVTVTFGMEDDQVRMRVRDNGKGFDPLNGAGAGGSHFGLSIMRERAENLGGKLQVQSAPGEGTCVDVEVPINRDAMLRGKKKGNI